VSNSYSLEFNRAYGPALGQGTIRRSVEEFQVDEILGFEPGGTGEHVYLWIKKTGANTGWVADQLAAFLNLRHFDVGYSGRKDRHAITKQWFSCWLPGKADPDWSQLDIEGVELIKAVRHDKKLRRGVHRANRFKIKVSCLTCGSSEAALNERLTRIKVTGFPNYFGPQRFGHEGHNLIKAEALFSEAFSGALSGESSPNNRGRKQRGLYISAARSYMFNHELSARVASGAWHKYAQAMDPSPETNESIWLFGLAPHRDITVPDLEEFVEWGEGLKLLGIKAMRRNLAVIPGELSWEFVAENGSGTNGLDLSFMLPGGAYATSLLHELIDYSTSQNIFNGEPDR